MNVGGARPRLRSVVGGSFVGLGSALTVRIQSRFLRVQRALFQSIRVRLLCIIGASILPFIFLLTWSGEHNRQRYLDLAESRLLQSASLIAAEQKQILESARQLLTAMALTSSSTQQDPIACRVYLAHVQKAYQRYFVFILFDANGSIICEFPSDNRVIAESGLNLFQASFGSSAFVVSRYAKLTEDRLPVLPMTYTVRDDAGSIVEVLATALRIDWLDKYLVTLSLPAGLSVTLLGPFGSVLTSHPDEPFPSGFRPEWWRQDTINDAQIVRTGDRIIALARAAEGGLTVAVSQPTGEIAATATHLLLLELATGGVVLFAAGGIAWTVGEVAILRRIRRLGRVACSLESGDLEARYGSERESDELDQLGQAFDRMASVLQRRMDELARSNRDLQQFAGVVSHDLQEPLRMVSSYCDLLRRQYQGSLDADADRFIEFAVDGARRMQLLIQDLLAYARIGSREQPLTLIDMTNVCELALANLKLAIEESGATISAGLLPIVLGDKLQLAQLLQNLFGNAIKYQREGKPKIQVTAERRGSCWVFAVIDNGIGIDPKFADKIFEIFKRLHTRDEYIGTGIGLAICKRIVERHGGEIWLDCGYCDGARFCFTLPADRDQRL
jgi:signal transduction histidine kinase